MADQLLDPTIPAVDAYSPPEEPTPETTEDPFSGLTIETF